MSGNKKIIHFLSASDRINYGDLLFPIIFKKMLKIYNIEAEFYNYGIVKSDLSHFGALPTKSYKKFQEEVNKNKGNIVVGGGEVFFANWRTLYSFINPYYAHLLKFEIFKKLDEKINFPKRLLSKDSSMSPFVPLKNNSKLFFSSVGGRFYGKTDNNKYIANLLEEADFISVRDKRTKNSLKEYNVDSILVPDSAILMSDLFSIEFLKSKTSSNLIFDNKDYLLLQVGINKGPENLKDFASQILKQATKLKLEIILCPIGMAPNHEDHKILNEMAKISDSFNLVIPKGIYEIMYLIARSKIFVGTSLHGIITAQSFNRPFVALNRKVVKSKVYISTWMPAYQDYNLDFTEINKLSTLMNKWSSNALVRYTREQKLMVSKNLTLIFSNLI
ncbi:polysaccharide pyruvyl transferase family protein [Zunongwangia sp. HRR-M8]|uniref:polysaccharide pyruvyl transferase family protein n=1 Tax=Zunongwangia sp. HRR-M8 TaxID=3015170 RepID=UPI0022DE5D35|nr:polysaccharide pyruvyl transferase family protein [Zunongwangia sp. HRR-M8]WBL23182.1 polysaccharide pyruvyl transferase family protein [Zunongwangia sp. HRR-M8]